MNICIIILDFLTDDVPKPFEYLDMSVFVLFISTPYLSISNISLSLGMGDSGSAEVDGLSGVTNDRT